MSAAARPQELGRDWVVLQDCRLRPSDRGVPPSVLIHPARGVAVVDILPSSTPEAAEAVRERLDAARFPALFAGHLPVIHMQLTPGEMPFLASLLDRAFAARSPLRLPGGDAWTGVVVRALTAAEQPGPRLEPQRSREDGGPTRRRTAAQPEPRLEPRRSSPEAVGGRKRRGTGVFCGGSARSLYRWRRSAACWRCCWATRSRRCRCRRCWATRCRCRRCPLLRPVPRRPPPWRPRPKRSARGRPRFRSHRPRWPILFRSRHRPPCCRSGARLCRLGGRRSKPPPRSWRRRRPCRFRLRRRPRRRRRRLRPGGWKRPSRSCRFHLQRRLRRRRSSASLPRRRRLRPGGRKRLRRLCRLHIRRRLRRRRPSASPPRRRRLRPGGRKRPRRPRRGRFPRRSLLPGRGGGRRPGSPPCVRRQVPRRPCRRRRRGVASAFRPWSARARRSAMPTCGSSTGTASAGSGAGPGRRRAPGCPAGERMTMRIYLAGPEVFLPDGGAAVGAAKRAICAARGLVGVLPVEEGGPAVAARRRRRRSGLVPDLPGQRGPDPRLRRADRQPDAVPRTIGRSGHGVRAGLHARPRPAGLRLQQHGGALREPHAGGARPRGAAAPGAGAGRTRRAWRWRISTSTTT